MYVCIYTIAQIMESGSNSYLLFTFFFSTAINSTDSTTRFPHGSQKMMGLFRKRYYVFIKKLKIHVIQWLIALGIVLLTVILSHASSTRTAGGSGKEERLQFDLSSYGNTKVFYGGSVVNLLDTYANIVKDQGSVSARSFADVNSGNEF